MSRHGAAGTPSGAGVDRAGAGQLPKSERGQGTQKPCSWNNARQPPQVRSARQRLQRRETVSTETLEMTSRPIEKKAANFGVEVRTWWQASPGPVMHALRDRARHGRQGAQVVNLAKDLARSLSLVSIPRRRNDSRQELHGARAAQPRPSRSACPRSSAPGPPTTPSMLTRRPGQDIIGNRWWPTSPRCRTCWWPAPPAPGKSVGINAMILKACCTRPRATCACS